MSEEPMNKIVCPTCEFLGRHTLDLPVTVSPGTAGAKAVRRVDMIVCGPHNGLGHIILRYQGGEFYVIIRDKKLNWNDTNFRVKHLSTSDEVIVRRGIEKAHNLAFGNVFCRGQAMLI